MGIQTKEYSPLVSATKFDVAPVSVADETGYTGVVGAGSARCIAFASMPKGRALKMHVNVGALSGSPTGIQVGLGVNDDANGTRSSAARPRTSGPRWPERSSRWRSRSPT